MFDMVNKKNNKHWLYLIPTLVILTVFSFLPLAKTILIAFDQDYNQFENTLSYNFNLKNIKHVFQDITFRQACFNNLLLIILVIPISLVVSLLIALALHNVYNKRLKNILQTTFFFPLLSNTIVMGMVFSVLFYYNFSSFSPKNQGLFNFLLESLGGKAQDWIGPNAAYGRKLFVLVFYNTWHRLSFKIFVFLLALQEINKSYYDAAKIDGASKWRAFTKITLPLLKTTFLYQFIIEMLALCKEFVSVYALFGNNPDYKIKTIAFYIYEQTSNSTSNSYAKSAVAALILLCFCILFTSISLYFSRNKS